ncbi:MAG: glycosyltransferase family 4 protein [Ignisphaera sp.]
MREEKLLVVASPFPISGGGSLRALRSVNEYSRYFNIHLYLPYGSRRYQNIGRFLGNLVRSGISIAGLSRLPKIVSHIDRVLSGRVSKVLIDFMYIFIAKPKFFARGKYGCVISLHESIDSVYAGYTLSKLFNTSAICLLQLPPFYGSKERLNNIMRSHILWRKYTISSNLVELLSSIGTIAEYNIINTYMKKIYNHILHRYDVIMAVSRSIPYEMGSEWIIKIYALDPGVSLDDEDLEIISKIKSIAKEKERYIVFGGRPIATKGVIEALIVFGFISRRISDIKLIFTGSINDAVLRKIMHLCKKLGIEDKVLFTGFISRDKRFEIVAKAKLMLYPSHIDAFPYAVLESLYLGTPVVGYDIPALRFYYSGNPGVKLVREWDLEALATEAINILEKGIETIELPKIPSWRDIMNKEVALIRKVIERTG